jgi:AbrB family looped-hinge helix DNA binding protein
MSSVISSTAKVDSAGRIVLPAEGRKELGLHPGSEVIVHFDDGEFRVTTREEAIRRIQARVRKYIPAGVSLVDELIAERRAEAKRELED